MVEETRSTIGNGAGEAVSKAAHTNSLGSVKTHQTFKTSGTPLIGSKDIVPVDDPHNVQDRNATHTLQFSSPELAEMIKESQAAMFMHTNPNINTPLVSLNTSVHEVPSQSMECFGDQGSDSGKQLISTDNNQHVEKGMA